MSRSNKTIYQLLELPPPPKLPPPPPKLELEELEPEELNPPPLLLHPPFDPELDPGEKLFIFFRPHGLTNAKIFQLIINAK